MALRRVKRKPNKKSVVSAKKTNYRKKIIQNISIGLVLLFGLIGLVFYFKNNLSKPIFPVKNIVFDSELTFANQDNLSFITNNYLGKNLLTVDLQQLTKSISKVSWVKEIKVERKFPYSLILHIVERIPVANWGKGEFLDDSGVRFSIPDNNETIDYLVTLFGPNGYEKILLDKYKHIHLKLSAMDITIKSLVLDKRLNWQLILANDITIHLDKRNLDNQLDKLKVIYPKIIEPYQEYITAVNLRYHNGFSLRWKNNRQPKNLYEELKQKGFVN